MNWRNPASLNWLLTPEISPSPAIPPKSHEAEGSSQPPECFSVSQDLIRCWVSQPCFCSCCPRSNQSNPSFTDFLSCAKVGRVAELPSELSLLPCSCVTLHSGACVLQAAQVSLLGSPWGCPAAQWSLCPWLQFYPSVPVINNCDW